MRNLAGTVSETIALTTTETPDIFSLVVNIVPSNPVEALASGDMLQIIFMAILTGLAIQVAILVVAQLSRHSRWLTKS